MVRVPPYLGASVVAVLVDEELLEVELDVALDVEVYDGP